MSATLTFLGAAGTVITSRLRWRAEIAQDGQRVSLG
jgi:hypothetical protein